MGGTTRGDSHGHGHGTGCGSGGSNSNGTGSTSGCGLNGWGRDVAGAAFGSKRPPSYAYVNDDEREEKQRQRLSVDLWKVEKGYYRATDNSS